MKRIGFIISVLLIWMLPVKASHLLGGEVSYRALDSLGNYRFTVVVFRACDGISFQQGSVTLQGPVSVSCPLVASYDITPRTPGAPGNLRCDPPATFNGAVGSIGKFVYEGNANLSTLTAAPVGGYTWFTSDIPCCRNSNQNAQGCSGMTLRVTMHAFTTTTGTRLTPRQMRDSSPKFLEDPAAVAINNPFDTAYFNNFAQDPDREDDVRFDIDFPWQGNNQPCGYNNGYTQAVPMPGLLPAGAPPIDSINGVITYRPITNGAYLLLIRVRSFRCGQLVSEVFRDFQLNVINNPVGSRNPFNPFSSATEQLMQQKAPIFTPFLFDAAGNPSFDIEIYALDTLALKLQAYDYYPLFDPSGTPGVPGPYNPNTVSLFITGPQIGANGTSTTTGCQYPPCATISETGGTPPQPIRYIPPPAGEVLGFGYSSLQVVTADLNWVPGCNNLPQNTQSSCGVGLTAYQFGVVAFDNNSPLRGRTSQVYSVRVKALPELDAPVLRCLSVTDDNQGVRLTWSQFVDTTTIDPLDTLNFNQFSDSLQRVFSVQRRYRSLQQYRVYRSTNVAGPYALVGSTTPNQFTDTTFTDNTVVPGTQYYYYVVNVSGCFNRESGTSDTLKTISLSLNNNVSAGLAELSWDSLSLREQFSRTSKDSIFIEREVYTINPGVWERMDTLASGMDWDQPVLVCLDSVNYRVGYLDSSGCVSYSWVAGAVFEDIFPPAQVTMVQASVNNATGQPYLTWDPSISQDVTRYVIYRVDSSTTPPSQFALDTVNGYLTTSWSDGVSGQNPYDSVLFYGVAAIDSCGNLGLMSIPFNTMRLEAEMNQCISSMELSWNHYGGWGGAISRYRITRQDGAGAPYITLGTVPATGTSYDFIDNQNLVQDTVYCYIIEAVRSDDSVAYSSMACVQAKIITPPMLTYVRKVNVDTLTGVITVDFMSDTLASSARFVLERGISGNDFRELTSYDVSQMVLNGPFWTQRYVDTEAKPGENAYMYRVLVYDICSQLFDTSEVASSIFLQGVPAIDFTNELKWNDYTSWLGGVESYTILRRIPQTDPEYLPINQTMLGAPAYDDDISAFTDNDGNYLYFIQALEGNSNPLGLKDTVTSNVIEVVQQPRIYFPNAFLPLGVNREFRGKGVFIEEDRGFSLQVYNRWGERLFESTDYTLGWDGKAGDGSVVSQGVYVYIVNFVGKNDKVYNQKGTITVLR